jgi:hypothetical protein
LTTNQRIVLQGRRGIFDRERMKSLICIFWLVLAGLWSAVLQANAQVKCHPENNDLSRDGLYIDPAFTPSQRG